MTTRNIWIFLATIFRNTKYLEETFLYTQSITVEDSPFDFNRRRFSACYQHLHTTRCIRELIPTLHNINFKKYHYLKNKNLMYPYQL